MKLIEVKERTPLLIEQLTKVWESSVKATHLFLSGCEIEKIKKFVPQALKGIDCLIVAESESKGPVAFMGVRNKLWKCCLSLPKQGERAWERSLFDMESKTIPSIDWLLMSKIPLRSVFMNTWDFEFIRERTMTNREIRIRFYI